MTQNGIKFNEAVVFNDLKKYKSTGPIMIDENPKSNLFK